MKDESDNLWLSPAAATVWVATHDMERVRRLQRPIPNGRLADDPHGDREETALALMAKQAIVGTFRSEDNYRVVTGRCPDPENPLNNLPVSDDERRAVIFDETKALASYLTATQAVRAGFLGGWRARGSREIDGPIEAIDLAERRRRWHNVVLCFADIEASFPPAPEPAPRSRPLPEKKAKQFARQFIENEKAAGRIPTLKRLETAHRESGLRGGRESLRAEFHKRCGDVKRGRPPKSPK